MKKESESQTKELQDMKQTVEQYKEIQTGLGQRVNEDIDNSKEITEMKAQISKVSKKMKSYAKIQHIEMTNSTEKVRFVMCKFIENVKTLIERMTDRVKKVEAV